MQVVLNGLSQGNAAFLRISHKSQSGSGTPQIAILYASGFVRLKQNADVSPAIPFGSSFVLGPAYWSDASTYHHNPQLSRLEINTTWLPNAPLRLWAKGTNQDFDVAYEMALPPAQDWQTRLHVTQTYTATASITIDSTRQAEHQGLKLVQISSMFINQGSACDGGNTDCHDSNAARFIGNDLVRHQAVFTDLAPSAFVFSSTVPLGSTWLDALHTDDQSWHSSLGTSGNTPNVRIALDSLPLASTITAQGWISATTNPDDDNVGLWLNDDDPASGSWSVGKQGSVGYWLIAQDNPPEPWADQGLRSGLTFLNFEGSSNCFFVNDGGQPTSGAVGATAGYSDTALQLSYDLGSTDWDWVQVRCNFNPPLDLSAYDHLRLDWRGDPAAGNSLQVGLINPDGVGESIFAPTYHHATHHAWWGQLVIPFSFLTPWTNGATFDPSQVSAFIISVVKDPADDVGGVGSIAIDNLNAYNVISRTVPSTFEMAGPNFVTASGAAVNWLASQQRSTGLLKSWEGESICNAHTYDQAVALMMFARERMWTQADALVNALVTTQNTDGSWFQSRNCDTLAALDSNKWEGDIAWAIYALSRYRALGGPNVGAKTAMLKGADWLAGRVSVSDGCLVIDHTEGTLDAWWALRAAGSPYTSKANGLKNCLLTYYWDETMGRFKGGRNAWQAYLDNQTWGAAFLKAIGQGAKAHRALSYAREVLRLPAQGGQLFGFDGQGGPWSVWNEGTAQYIALGGNGGSNLLLELLAQQRKDGAMPGSPDEFSGGGVWTTRWYGVAPTAWLYYALHGDCQPFPSGATAKCFLIYLPIVRKN
jgi:hypothetical protein